MEYISNTSIPLNYVKMEPLVGSYKGMRYRLFVAEKSQIISACIWPEPYCFAKTADELKQTKEFMATEEGKAECVAWLNQQFEEQAALWSS